MTDRHTGYVVVLDADMREDGAQDLISAIRMVKGVQQVTPIVSEPGAAALATLRRDNEWREALFAFVQQGPGALGAQP